MQTETISLISKSLEKAMDYEAYRALVTQLLGQGKSTGAVQTQALLEYSKLNDQRMRRLDKTVKIPDEAGELVSSYQGDITWLVISEGWCGDAAQTLPVMNKLANLNKGIHLKIVLRDENESLMNNYLTDGNRSIPKLIMIENNTKKEIDTWGPRPSIATRMVKDHKEKFGILTPEFKKDLQLWYNKDKGRNTLEDLLKLLALI